jgi:hypothetical protein
MWNRMAITSQRESLELLTFRRKNNKASAVPNARIAGTVGIASTKYPISTIRRWNKGYPEIDTPTTHHFSSRNRASRTARAPTYRRILARRMRQSMRECVHVETIAQFAKKEWPTISAAVA